MSTSSKKNINKKNEVMLIADTNMDADSQRYNRREEITFLKSQDVLN